MTLCQPRRYGISFRQILERLELLFEATSYGTHDRTTIMLVEDQENNCHAAIENSSSRGKVSIDEIFSTFPEVIIADMHVNFFTTWLVLGRLYSYSSLDGHTYMAFKTIIPP